MTMGYRPSFDLVSVAVSMPADVTRSYAGIWTDPPKAPEYDATLVPKYRKTRQSSGPALPFPSAPHRHGGLASPKAVQLEQASRH
jgi:hypothetical protein